MTQPPDPGRSSGEFVPVFGAKANFSRYEEWVRPRPTDSSTSTYSAARFSHQCGVVLAAGQIQNVAACGYDAAW